jgi:hypothetical protein
MATHGSESLADGKKESAESRPDLARVTGRVSRADLFTAILQLSVTCPSGYQTTLVETTDGKVYQGLWLMTRWIA